MIAGPATINRSDLAICVPRSMQCSLESQSTVTRRPALGAASSGKDKRNGGLLISCARGLRRPSLDARTGDQQSPIPGEKNERAWGIIHILANPWMRRKGHAMHDHCLPQASFHKSSSGLPGKIRSHVPFPELRSRMFPLPILPEIYITASPSKRCLAQSYSICAFADKYEMPAFVCAVLKSNSTHIFTRSPSRLLVVGSA